MPQSVCVCCVWIGGGGVRVLGREEITFSLPHSTNRAIRPLEFDHGQHCRKSVSAWLIYYTRSVFFFGLDDEAARKKTLFSFVFLIAYVHSEKQRLSLIQIIFLSLPF